MTVRDGQKYESEYLIFAAPPPCINRIQFEPALSRERRLIASRYRMGRTTKMVLLYDRAYWLERGFSGQVLSDCTDSPVFMTFDETKLNSEGQRQPAITVFFVAGIDEVWTEDREACMRAVTQKLASHFQCEAMLAPLAYDTLVWSDQQSLMGAPTAYLPPGCLSKIQDVRRPEGRIHWAGTELARVSSGFMDGAIESGLRCADEIVRRTKGVAHPSPTATLGTKWYTNIIRSAAKWLDWV